MNAAEPDAFLGLDLGTSGLKGVVCSGSGEVLGHAQAAYPTARSVPGAAEQDPADWREAVRAVLGDLGDQVPPHRWRCLGLSAMIPTLVTTDDSGAPIGHAVTWEDARAEAQAAALRSRAGDLYRVTGQRLDGRYLFPMAARLGADAPESLRAAAWMLGAKDHLFWWLTGLPATDPSTAAGSGAYELRSGVWSRPMSEALAALLPGRQLRLPPVHSATTRRPVRRQLAAELGLPGGLEICLGAADSVAAAVGLGATEPGTVAYVAGTSTVILGVSAQPDPDPEQRYLVTPMAAPDRWGLEMDLLATGAGLRWLAGLLGDTEQGLVERAHACDPLAAPDFLPFLSPGEQGALWDPDLTGSLTGLTLRHGPADLARGLLTGVLLESRRCLDVLADHASSAAAVYVGGGGMATRAMAQELSDATGRDVVFSSATTDHSALGAALIAARSCGVDLNARGDLAGAVRLTPDRETRQMWDTLGSRHDHFLAALRAG